MSNSSPFFQIPTRPLRWLLITLGLLTLFQILERSFQHSRVRLNITPSSYDWSTLRPHNPVASITPLPIEKPQKLRRVQHIPEKPHKFDISVQQQRCRAVKAAAEKAWASYQKRAQIRDEATPIQGSSQDTFGVWGSTLVDSLDTLWIMGMKKEFMEAVAAVANLDWSATTKKSCNVFETTVRYLGGLLSAYDLSKEHVLLAKAEELGHMLYMAFDTPN